MLNADPNQEELIQYRLKQAGDTVKEVRVLVENNLIKIAVNRVYYGMFYMVEELESFITTLKNIIIEE
jgi:uncharacterized protein (UPF0332 family)